jgi:hypothetical protein
VAVPLASFGSTITSCVGNAEQAPYARLMFGSRLDTDAVHRGVTRTLGAPLRGWPFHAAMGRRQHARAGALVAP